MAKLGRNRSRGSNVNVIVQLQGQDQLFDDIDSAEVTNNDNLITVRPLGAVFKEHDIDYGDYSIELKCGKTGSDTARFFQKIEEQFGQRALETPKGVVKIVTDARFDVNQKEVIVYHNCVFQFRTTSHSDADSEVSQSITVTASHRTFEQLIPSQG